MLRPNLGAAGRVRRGGYGALDAYQVLSMSVIRKVTPYLLRNGVGFAEYLGPPPRPWSLGFRRVARWAAEPDHPPSTLLRSGGPARQLRIGGLYSRVRARGARWKLSVDS
jgi:hypothetical protein